MQILIVYGVVFFILILLALWLFTVERRLRPFLARSKNKIPEALLLEHAKELEGLKHETEKLGQSLEVMKTNSLRSVQKIGIVRFNPFSDSGGDQSFAIVLLDGHDNGLVVSSIYSQGRPLVYAKPIEKGNSRYPLSGEERKALEKAAAS